MFFLAQIATGVKFDAQFVCSACGKTVQHRGLSFSERLPVGWAQIRRQTENGQHEYLACSLTCLYSLLNNWQDKLMSKGEVNGRKRERGVPGGA